MQRVTKQDAANFLKVSSATIDRMIQRGDLAVEYEPWGSRQRVWVLLDATEATPVAIDDMTGDRRAATNKATPVPTERVELITLRERVRGYEELISYYKKEHQEAELRFQQLMQQLAETTRQLPAPAPEPVAPTTSGRRRRWWPFSKAS